LLFALILLGMLLAPRAEAAPVAPGLSIIVSPLQLVPAQAGYAYVGGGYPLDVSVTLDGEPLDTFWSGHGYLALFSFDFGAPPGDHTIAVEVFNPAAGATEEEAFTVTVSQFTYPREQVALPARLIPLLDGALNEAELAKLDAVYSARTTLATWDWPFGSPVPGGVVTSRFGGSRTYNGGMFSANHTGMDFRRALGEPVYATAGGRVAVAEFYEVRGNLIIVDHGHGVFSQYAHLSEFYVEPGQFIHKGQLIGAAGATGRTNGPHLHFEIIVNGAPVDPLRWLALAPSFVPPREVTPIPSEAPEPTGP
jgi:murein DD-endopeptidase MepM/ murein hydrolase activator NlpD